MLLLFGFASAMPAPISSLSSDPAELSRGGAHRLGQAGQQEGRALSLLADVDWMYSGVYSPGAASGVWGCSDLVQSSRGVFKTLKSETAVNTGKAL